MQGLLRAAYRPRPISACSPWSTRLGSGYRHQLIRTLITKKFSSDHEMLVYNDETGLGTIYLTDHAQSSLGDVVYVDFEGLGKHVEKGATLGSLESVKAASDVYAPVSGTVTKLNENLIKEPSLLNKSTDDKGWFCEIKLSNPEEVDWLLDEEEYKGFL